MQPETTSSAGSEVLTHSSETLCDRVVVRYDDHDVRDMTFDEFMTIPLSTRIRYVIERRARFFADGVEIGSNEALSRLRKSRAAS